MICFFELIASVALIFFIYSLSSIMNARYNNNQNSEIIDQSWDDCKSYVNRTTFKFEYITQICGPQNYFAHFTIKNLFLIFLTTYNNHYNKIKYLPLKNRIKHFFFLSPTTNNKHVFKLKIVYFAMALIRRKLI